MAGLVRVVAPDGTPGTVPADQLDLMPPGTRVIDSAAPSGDDGGLVGGLAAGILGAGSVATMGMTDVAARDMSYVLGGQDFSREVTTNLRNVRERNPGSTMAGEFAGLFANPEALAGAGDAAAGLVAGEGLTAAMARSSARLAAESALMGAQRYTTEEALGDPQLSGEMLFSEMGKDALIGAALGAPLGAAGYGASKAFGAIRKTAGPIASKYLDKLVGIEGAGRGVLEQARSGEAAIDGLRASGATSEQAVNAVSELQAMGKAAPQAGIGRQILDGIADTYGDGVAREAYTAARDGAEHADERRIRDALALRDAVTGVLRNGEDVANNVQFSQRPDRFAKLVDATKGDAQADAIAKLLQETDAMLSSWESMHSQGGEAAGSIRSLRKHWLDLKEALPGAKVRTGFEIPPIDADAGLAGGALGTKKPISIGRGLGIDPDAGIYAPEGKITEPIFPSGKVISTKDVRRVPLSEIEMQDVWDPTKLTALRAKRAAGVDLDPVRLVRGPLTAEGAPGKYVIEDGIHRIAVALERGETDILARTVDETEPMRLAGDVFRAGKGKVPIVGGAIREGTKIGLAADDLSEVAAGRRPLKINPTFAPDGADLNTKANAFKQALDRQSAWGRGGGGVIDGERFRVGIPGATQDITRLADSWRAMLEDTGIWGRAGEVQARSNGTFSELLPRRNHLMGELAADIDVSQGMRIPEGDFVKARSFLDKITGNPDVDEALQPVISARRWIDGTRARLEALREGGISAEEGAKFAAAEAAVSNFETTLNDAMSEAAKQNRIASAAHAEHGGMIGGLSGLVADAFMRPVTSMHRLGRLAQVAEKAESAIRTSFRSFGEKMGTGEAAAQTAPRPREKVIEEIGAIRELVSNPVALEAAAQRMVGDLSNYAPRTANELRLTAMRSLIHLAREAPRSSSTETGTFGKVEPRYSDIQIHDWEAKRAAVFDGKSLAYDLRSGVLNRDAIKAAEHASPKLFAKLQEIGLDELDRMQQDGTLDRMSYQDKAAYATLLRIPPDQTWTGPFIAMIQSSKSAPAPSSEASPPTGGRLPTKSNQKPMGDMFRTDAQSIAAGGDVR